jgi:bacteriocin biosynthesis cyclodehydratase domain-containing protein
MRHFVVLTQGSFGDAVADSIAAEMEIRRGPLRAPLSVTEELIAGARFVAVALWRREPAACEEIDALCARLGVPWSIAQLEGSELWNGPVVIPGSGPCYGCVRKRWQTHSVSIDRENALDAYYDANPESGPRGFLPGVVASAAAGLCMDWEDGVAAAGRVRILHLLDGNLLETRGLAVHGCLRCGSGEAARPDRYVSDLRKSLLGVML